MACSLDRRELDSIPAYPEKPYGVNTLDIAALSEAKNFLYLINPGSSFPDKQSFLDAVRETDYDIVIIDLFYYGAKELSKEDINSLKTKHSSGRRLVIAYLSIGEAETYRYYWHNSWERNPPAWLEEENPYWPGNYKVRYWDAEWQEIVYGNDNSYLNKIIAAGFNGVCLDIIDAYQYFEAI